MVMLYWFLYEARVGFSGVRSLLVYAAYWSSTLGFLILYSFLPFSHSLVVACNLVFY